MLRRRALQVLTGSAIIGLSATGLAAPAQASDFTVTLTGNYSWVPGEGQDYWLLDGDGGGLTVPFDTTGATMTFNAFGGFKVGDPRYSIVVLSPQLSFNGASCASGCEPVWNQSNTFDIAPGANGATVQVGAVNPDAGGFAPAYDGSSLLSFTVTNPAAPAAPTITGVSPSTGPEAGGTSVTISGTDLDNASSVTFGGNAAASFTVDDSTQITATTPAGTAGAVDVVVTTPGGDDTSVGAFTYTAPAPDPTPTPATPPSAPESGDVEPGSGEVTVSWEPPATQGSFPVTNYQVQSTPGSAGCLVAATQRQCTVSGLTNGRSYSFQVRALNGGGWGPWADAGSATPVAPAEATILISGTRGDVRGKPGIIVTGTTTGLTEGSTLHPWIRLDGRRSSRMGEALITLDASGEFTWQRRVNRNIDVQIRSADGSVRSQELRITVR